MYKFLLIIRTNIVPAISSSLLTPVFFRAPIARFRVSLDPLVDCPSESICSILWWVFTPRGLPLA